MAPYLALELAPILLKVPRYWSADSWSILVPLVPNGVRKCLFCSIYLLAQFLTLRLFRYELR